MKGLLLLAALCALTTAMVPRERRAVNTEEEPRPSTVKPICAASTPCGWVFYRPYSKDITDLHVDNSYCHCDVGRTCQIDEDDTSASSYIKRCKPVSQAPQEPAES